MTIEKLNWKTTISRMKADRGRLALLLSLSPNGLGILVRPSFLCVAMYRISNHFNASGRTLVARFMAQVNQLLTGADISPAADIAEGFVILTPPGTAISGKAGRNLTVMPCAGLGGEIGRLEDVGGGPGLPVLGDDVILEPHGGVLGPTKIGNRVRVGAGVMITRDVPDDTTVEGPPPRFRARARKQLS